MLVTPTSTGASSCSDSEGGERRRSFNGSRKTKSFLRRTASMPSRDAASDTATDSSLSPARFPLLTQRQTSSGSSKRSVRFHDGGEDTAVAQGSGDQHMLTQQQTGSINTEPLVDEICARVTYTAGTLEVLMAQNPAAMIVLPLSSGDNSGHTATVGGPTASAPLSVSAQHRASQIAAARPLQPFRHAARIAPT